MTRKMVGVYIQVQVKVLSPGGSRLIMLYICGSSLQTGCAKFSRGKYDVDGLFSLNHSVMSNVFTQCVPVHIICVNTVI
jgi:hypothetical protein